MPRHRYMVVPSLPRPPRRLHVSLSLCRTCKGRAMAGSFHLFSPSLSPLSPHPLRVLARARVLPTFTASAPPRWGGGGGRRRAGTWSRSFAPQPPPRLRWRRDGGCGLPHRCRPVSPPAPPPRLRTCCSSTYRRRCIAVAPPLLRPAPPSTCRPRPIHSSLPLPSSPCRSDSARCRAPAGRDGPGRAGPGRAGAVGMASGFGGGARRAAHEFRPRSVEPWLPGGGAAHAPCAARGTASHGSSNQPARWLLLPSLENSIATLSVARVGVELVSRQGRG